MKKFIEKLRQKSDEQKNLIAFVTALSITAIVFSIWLATTVYVNSNKVDSTNTANLIDSLKNSFNSLK